MGWTLVISAERWNELRGHLLADSDEHLAFLLARTCGDRLLVSELICISDADLEGEAARYGLALKLPALLNVMNVANKRRQVLVEAHSHPFSSRAVAFSGTDLEGQEEMVKYLADTVPGKPYAALVLGQETVYGHVWQPGHQGPHVMGEIRVIGSVLQRHPGDGIPSTRRVARSTRLDTHHRQVLAIGSEGQSALERTTVAIAGAGGLGSIVGQHLAHLGVCTFTLIDDDTVDLTNLHRLVGASKNSVGDWKVEVLKNLVTTVNPKATVLAVRDNIRSTQAIAAVKGTDVVVGCVDTDAGRLILNELTLSYDIPYIDCGVGVNVQDGRIAEAGGRVIVWVPGRPCLLCCREIDVRIAAEELESAEEREFRRRHGYIAGADVPEPAVISLNGTIASLAVTELLALITGFRQTNHYTYYDMLEQRVGPRIVHRNAGCTACAMEGLGDVANIGRYSRRGLPGDLPKL